MHTKHRGLHEIYVGNSLSPRTCGVCVLLAPPFKKTIVSNFGNLQEKSKVTPTKFPTPYSWPRFEVTMTRTPRCVCVCGEGVQHKFEERVCVKKNYKSLLRRARW